MASLGSQGALLLRAGDWLVSPRKTGAWFPSATKSPCNLIAAALRVVSRWVCGWRGSCTFEQIVDETTVSVQQTPESHEEDTLPSP